MKHIYMLLAVAVVVGGGAFFGGMKYGQSRGAGMFQNMSPEDRRAAFASGQVRSTDSGQGGGFRNGGGTGARTGGGNFAGGGLVNGEIISRDAQSVTVKLRDGGSKIVLYSEATHITKPTDGSGDDLTEGKQVAVNGTANSDGSITAESIQVRPAQSASSGPSTISTPSP